MKVFSMSMYANKSDLYEAKSEYLLNVARIMAGLISTMPQFSDKHPDEVLNHFMDEAEKL